MQNSTFWCEGCWKDGKIPKGIPPLLIQYPLGFLDLWTLCRYIEGERDIDTLMRIDDIKEYLDYELMKILRKVLKKDGEVSDSD